jgi:hypothetical protein
MAMNSSNMAWVFAPSGSARLPGGDCPAREHLSLGSNFTRPSHLEAECAEQFLSLVDWAEMVKFCKDGSDATSSAVHLRAHTPAAT